MGVLTAMRRFAPLWGPLSVVLLLSTPLHGAAGPETPDPLPGRPAPSDTETLDPPFLTLTRAQAMSRLEASPELRRRFAALARPHPEGRAWRVVQLGDSHTEWGGFAEPFATALAEGGVVSPGFVAPYSRGLNIATLQLSKGWRRSTWRKHVGQGSDGPSGSTAETTRKGARATLKLPAGLPEGTTLTVYWDAAPGTLLAVTAGTKTPVLLTRELLTREADDPRPMAQKTLRIPAGTREVQLVATNASGARPMRLCGVTVDRPDARVQFDALGLGGTTHQHPLQGEQGALLQFLTGRRPDLVVVWYGSNSIPERNLSEAQLSRPYDELLGLLGAAAPDAAFLAMGPPDLDRKSDECRVSASRKATKGRAVRSTPAVKRHRRSASHGHGKGRGRGRAHSSPPKKRPPAPVVELCATDGPLHPDRDEDPCRPRTHANVVPVRDVLARVARQHGAAFFDLYELMGGSDAMLRWHCRTPPLAMGDLVHLTGAGYRELALALVEALRRAESG